MKVLTAFYDLAYGPVSFDFATWLVRAMKRRDELGFERLHVVVVPKEDGLGGFAREWGKHDEFATYWRLWHIVAGVCPLARASLTIAATREQARLFVKPGEDACWWPEGKAHFMGPLVEASRRGEPIPRFKPTVQARHHVEAWTNGCDHPGRIVTLTLRHQSTDKDRNTDPAQWARFQTWLESQGWEVTVLHDTREALDQGRAFAELDPDLRLALYQRAAMNVIGNNGPQELLKFSAAPYLVVGVGMGGWAEHFRKYFSMEPGEQLPWARPDQRLCYQPDSFETLRDEFQRTVAASTPA